MNRIIFSILFLMSTSPVLAAVGKAEVSRDATRRVARLIPALARQPTQRPTARRVATMVEEIQKAPPGFEPGMADLQSAALAAWLRRHLPKFTRIGQGSAGPKSATIA